MKGLLLLILLSGLAYGGYLYYQTSQSQLTLSNPDVPTSSNLILTQTSDKLGSTAQVLGASISNFLDNSQLYLAEVTDGASEPIINQLVIKTQETLKDLPKREAERIKYEFCKGIIEEYENKSSVN